VSDLVGSQRTRSDGSYLAEIVNKSVRGGRTRIALANVDGDLQLATHIPVRVIEYRVENHTATSETFRLITTILDQQEASADELGAAYHQRWELETSFREIETYLRVGKGIRSKHRNLFNRTYGAYLSPTMRSALSCPKPPIRSKLTPIDYLLHEHCTSCAAGSPIQRYFPSKAKRQLHARDIAETIERLNKRLPRTYPGVSKKGNRHSFPTKKPEHHQQRYDPRTILLDRRLPA
jgi:hypothetical protein